MQSLTENILDTIVYNPETLSTLSLTGNILDTTQKPYLCNL